jgi:hypothetical protein
MRVVTHPVDPVKWQVIAQWYGQDRVVFEGTIFGCLEFLSQNAC